jgi:hypothetical protein
LRIIVYFFSSCKDFLARTREKEYGETTLREDVGVDIIIKKGCGIAGSILGNLIRFG